MSWVLFFSFLFPLVVELWEQIEWKWLMLTEFASLCVCIYVYHCYFILYSIFLWKLWMLFFSVFFSSLLDQERKHVLHCCLWNVDQCTVLLNGPHAKIEASVLLTKPDDFQSHWHHYDVWTGRNQPWLGPPPTCKLPSLIQQSHRQDRNSLNLELENMILMRAHAVTY